MDLGLEGKVAIVTGASRGIGSAIAAVLADEGACVVAVARTRADLDRFAEPRGDRALALDADLRDAAAAERVVATAVKHFGALDVLVNNAGTATRGDFLTLADSAWDDGFALKFFGAMRLCRAAWPHLRARGGSIVNVAGVGGRTGSAEFAIGGAVNAAVMNLTKVLADRGIAEGVRVNAVNPGGVATERLRSRIRQHAADKGISEEEAAASMSRALGTARYGEPAEIARVVAFLASPSAAYVQGAVVDVDGGQTRTL